VNRVLQLPAALVGSVTVALVIVLAVVGLLLARRVFSHDRLKPTETATTQVLAMSGLLYAVLVAFVVVIVWQQFNDAQKRTEEEAVAISDLLHDSDGLPATGRPAVQQTLIDYAKDVVDGEFPRMRRGESIEQESSHLTKVWRDVLTIEPSSESEKTLYTEVVTKVNDLASARTARIAAADYHIPGELWVMLLGGGAIILIFTYLFPTPDAVLHSVLIGLAAALMAFVLYLIFAMEHPFVGTIAVSDHPYVNVLDAWAKLKPQ
jgi:hypothetical protein